MLCLNGFGMPSAMAHASKQDGEPAPASGMAPCHEGIAAASSAIKPGPADPASPHDRDSGCCANGQCFCGCIVSAVFTVPMLAATRPASSGRAFALDGPDFPPAHSSVLQRPPIA